MASPAYHLEFLSNGQDDQVWVVFEQDGQDNRQQLSWRNGEQRVGWRGEWVQVEVNLIELACNAPPPGSRSRQVAQPPNPNGLFLQNRQPCLPLQVGGLSRVDARVARADLGALRAFQEERRRRNQGYFLTAWDWQQSLVPEEGGNLRLDFAPVLEAGPCYLLVELGSSRQWQRSFWLDANEVALTLFRRRQAQYLWRVNLPTQEGDVVGVDPNNSKEIETMVEGRRLACPPIPPWHISWDPGKWAVFSDRFDYQPGEEAGLAGWVRLQSSPDQPLQLCQATRVSYTSERLGAGEVNLSPDGGFCLRLRVPPDCPTQAQLLTLRVQTLGGELLEHRHYLQVEAATPQDWQVQVEEVAGEPFCVQARVTHCNGRPVSGVEVAWHEQLGGHALHPPHWPGYAFGTGSAHHQFEARVHPGRTDSQGCHRLKLELPPLPQDSQVVANLTVHVQGRSEVLKRDYQLKIQRLNYGVGLRRERNRLWLVVADAQGKAQGGLTLRCSVGGQEWKRLTSQSEPVGLELTPLFQDSEVWLQVDLLDQTGQKLAWNGHLLGSPAPLLAEPTCTVVQPGEVEPGQIARLQMTLSPPWEGSSAGRGLLHVGGGDSMETCEFAVQPEVTPIDFRVPSGLGPRLPWRLDWVSALGRVTHHGWLSVSLQSQELQLALVLQTGHQQAQIGVTVDRANGSPAAGAEVLVMVLDQSAEECTGSGLSQHPLPTFYSAKPPWMEDKSTADHRFPPPTQPPYPRKWRPEPDRSGWTFFCNRPRPRYPKDPLQCWQLVKCDERGQVHLCLPLPARAATYTVKALAAWGADCFGRQRSRFAIESQRLEVAPQWPPFLRVGDKAELLLEVASFAPHPQKVELNLLAQGLEASPTGGWRLQLEPREVRHVPFAVTAHQAGRGQLRIGICCEGEERSEEYELAITDEAEETGSPGLGRTLLRRKAEISPAEGEYRLFQGAVVQVQLEVPSDLPPTAHIRSWQPYPAGFEVLEHRHLDQGQGWVDDHRGYRTSQITFRARHCGRFRLPAAYLVVDGETRIVGTPTTVVILPRSEAKD